MGKRIVVIAIAFLALTVGTTWAVLHQPAKATAKTVTIHGSDLLATTAASGDLTAAIQSFHEKFGQFIVDDKGQKSDPSFSQSARFWKSGLPPQEAPAVYIRSTTEFKDKRGLTVHIDMTQESGRPIFVLIDYHGKGGTMEIANGLIAEFHKMGIEVQ